MRSNPPTVFVSAPQGAGKTLNAGVLREMFQCTSVVDDWDGISEVPPGALVLTSEPPYAVRPSKAPVRTAPAINIDAQQVWALACERVEDTGETYEHAVKDIAAALDFLRDGFSRQNAA